MSSKEYICENDPFTNSSKNTKEKGHNYTDSTQRKPDKTSRSHTSNESPICKTSVTAQNCLAYDSNAELTQDISHSLSSEESPALQKEPHNVDRWLDQPAQEEPWSPVSRKGEGTFGTYGGQNDKGDGSAGGGPPEKDQ